MQDSEPGSLTAHTHNPPRILYLATTFPRFSETFLQREVRYLRNQHVQLDIGSLWGGEGNFDKQPVQTATLRDLPRALTRIPGWLLRKPAAFREILERLLCRRLPMVQNWLENFWGFAWALDRAGDILRNPPDLVHATWGTMPAATALALHKLTGLAYSMEAHAYDVFKHGGDWLLDEKMRHARFVRTSTRATRDRLIEIGADTAKLHLVRRGIDLSREPATLRPISQPMRILSIGRLVEKKDFSFQLAVYEALISSSFAFTAEIVGHGPLEERLRKEAHRRGLGGRVTFRGRLNYHNVEEAYRQADIFLFTGRIANNGDRDGLPNVIAEAMTHGLPVLTAPVAGALEAIEDGRTGFVLPKNSPRAWSDTLRALPGNPDLDQIRNNASKWIHENFDIQKNGSTLCHLLQAHAAPRPPI